MLQGFVKNHGWAQQSGRCPRRASPVARWVALVAAGATGAVALGAGCSSEGESLADPLDGWARSDTWEHADVIDFDNVAATSYRDTLAWVTRAEPGSGALTYWQIADRDPVTRIELPEPDAPVAIPVAVAQDNHRWAAAAVTRDAPSGTNTGTYVWSGDGTSGDRAGEPSELHMPVAAGGQPEILSLARSTEVTVAVGLTGGEPHIWLHRGSADSPLPARWRGEELDLDSEADLTSLRVGGDGERLVLAGVDEEGAALVWTSDDGSSWEPVSPELLPRDVGAVATLAVLAPGEVLLAWLGPDGVPGQGAGSLSIWQLEGTELTSMGTLEPGDESPYVRLDLNDATVAPDDDVLVVGEGIRDDGTRVPLAWSRRDDEWPVTEQEGLTSRLDHRLRAVAAVHGDEMMAVMTHVSFTDVELWRWHGD